MSRAVRSLLAVPCLLLVFAGCLGAVDPVDPPLPEEGSTRAPWAVVALIDTGINPYHVDFRLSGPLADAHPSTYIPTYPADVPVVNLTLDAADLDAALEADKAVWEALEPGTVYWFRGTKVTGISFGSAGSTGPIFSTGHGSMVASKAGGNEWSLCPSCHVVAVQGFTGAAVRWSAEQPWIDVQSNSWGPLPAFAWADRPGVIGEPDLDHQFEEAAGNQAVFVASGNGIAGALGVVGFPSPTDSTSGPPGVISVGGHDNGKTTMWTGWAPHVVADACSNWALVGNSMDEYSDSAGGGTSAASPYSAGAAAQMILEARRILASVEARDVATDVYATAGPGAVLPSSGPLADGDLTLDELKHTLFHTVDPRPQNEAASGAECGAASPYWTGIAWSTVPEQIPTDLFIGYGAVSNASLHFALDVLAGGAEPLDRAWSDDWYERDQELRRTYHHLL